MATRGDVSKALAVTCEFYGRTLSENAADMIMSDLAEFAPDTVLNAIGRCRKELSRFPTPADIISRIQANDGRPGLEEAWSLIPKDSMASAVWTVEMATAYGTAHPLLRDGDEIAARMAFKEVYEKLIKQAREIKVPATWSVSLGEDKSGRDAAISEAVRRNAITIGEAKPVPRIAAPPATKEDLPSVKPEEARKRIRLMIENISKAVLYE